MVAAILFILLAILLIVNVPVGIALGISTMGALLVGESLSLTAIPQALVTSCDSFPILAIPLFNLSHFFTHLFIPKSGKYSKKRI